MNYCVLVEEFGHPSDKPTGNGILIDFFNNQEEAEALALKIRDRINEYHHCYYNHPKSSHDLDECYYNFLEDLPESKEIQKQIRQMAIPEVKVKPYEIL